MSDKKKEPKKQNGNFSYSGLPSMAPKPPPPKDPPAQKK